jgi:hypothetical protein
MALRFKNCIWPLAVAMLTLIPLGHPGSEANRATRGVTAGEPFPSLQGTALDGKAVSIPVGNGKATIVGVAFSQKAENDLGLWLQPLYDTFLAKSDDVFAAGNFDGNVYLVAMLGGAASLAGKGLQAKMAKGVDAELKSHIVLCKQPAAALLKALNVSDQTKPYFVVLDAAGMIKAVASGAYTEAKMDEIAAKAGEVE